MSTPSAQATGTLARVVAATRSLVTMTRRAGSRSTQAPAGSPMTSQGAHAAAVRAPIQNGPAPKVGDRQQGQQDARRRVARAR